MLQMKEVGGFLLQVSDDVCDCEDNIEEVEVWLSNLLLFSTHIWQKSHLHSNLYDRHKSRSITVIERRHSDCMCCSRIRSSLLFGNETRHLHMCSST